MNSRFHFPKQLTVSAENRAIGETTRGSVLSREIEQDSPSMDLLQKRGVNEMKRGKNDDLSIINHLKRMLMISKIADPSTTTTKKAMT